MEAVANEPAPGRNGPANVFLGQDARKSDVQFRHIVDTLPAYVAYIDCDLRILMVNHTFEVWFGRPATEVVGQPVSTVLGAAYEGVRRHLEGALAGTVQNFQTGVPTVQGERRLAVTHLPDLDEGGRVRGIIVHGIDITERRRPEDQHHVSEERLSLALSAARSVGTWDRDIASNTVRLDETLARLYGIDPLRATAGIPFPELVRNIHPDDRERIEQAVAHAVRTGEEYVAEYRLLSSGGPVRWISARGRCSYGDDGRPTRFPGVAIDITERQRYEEAMLRTEKLAAVGRLASSIAHEINNPLESLTNLLYIIETSVEDRDTQDYVRMAQAELARIGQITTQTLRFFKQTTAPTTASPDDLISSVLALYQGRLSNAQIRVQRRVRGDTPGLWYENEVRQVLNNLIGNAIDAMRDGGCLAVRARPASDPLDGRAGVRITVSDTGPGIDAAILSRIFEPFYTTKGALGTGLGLWVCSQLVEKHKGRLGVHSSGAADHHGTTFSLFVPIVISRIAATDVVHGIIDGV